MDARELRLGNFVQWENEGSIFVCEVLTISKTSIRCKVFENDLEEIMCNNEELQPIPLTEKWRIELGFAYGNNTISRLKYETGFGKVEVWLSRVKYVHQLQNLYFAMVKKDRHDISEKTLNIEQ